MVKKMKNKIIRIIVILVALSPIIAVCVVRCFCILSGMDFKGVTVALLGMATFCLGVGSIIWMANDFANEIIKDRNKGE